MTMLCFFRSCVSRRIVSCIVMALSPMAVGCTAARTSRADTATSLPTVDRSTPQAAMRTIVDAIEREDEAVIADSLLVENDAEHKFPRAFARMMCVAHRYWTAVQDRWGRQEVIAAYVKRGIVLPDSYQDYRRTEWDIRGDRATARSRARTGRRIPNAISPLRRIDGQWLYVPPALTKPNQVDYAAGVLNKRAEGYAKLTADIAAGKFASIHEAIDVMYPRRPAGSSEPPQLDKAQLDPATIPGAMTSLGLAYQQRDARAAARFYHVDGPADAAARLVQAHVAHALAVHHFLETASDRIEAAERLALEFGLLDPRDDLFGHVITDWTIDGDRAMGTNDAGPADAMMRRVDGVWKIDLTPPRGTLSSEKVAAELRRQTQALTAVTRDVRETPLFTTTEVRAALKRHGLVPAKRPLGEGEVETD
jgi:hypothetical protein